MRISKLLFQLCLLRRDVSFLSKHFSQKFVQSCGPDTVNELQKGLEQLQNWASISWCGFVYLNFLQRNGLKNAIHVC